MIKIIDEKLVIVVLFLSPYNIIFNTSGLKQYLLRRAERHMHLHVV